MKKRYYILMMLSLLMLQAEAASPVPSGTLPVIHITTLNNVPVTSKDDYVRATYYVISHGVAGCLDIGSAGCEDTLLIKGRGNWTWTGFEKKPYRIKLNTKTALCGLKRNKHFALLAHADDWTGWLKNTLGFLLSEQMGLAWTPSQRPVEVVLNGDYIGLYMLTEVIRVDADRVDITEQEDEATEQVSGGWLVEIDNYEEPNRVTLTEPANIYHGEQQVNITPKSPELLSQQQYSYLNGEMNALNDALYSAGSTTLEQMLDIDAAARYYLVQELMLDCESFHGSCYLYKDAGDEARWTFGPVWDFGNAFNRCRWGNPSQFIYQQPEFSQVWIGQLTTHAVFQSRLQQVWNHWRYYDYAFVQNAIDSVCQAITQAAQADARRWPQYNYSNTAGQKREVMGYFSDHVRWLTQRWGAGEADPVDEVESVVKDAYHIEKMLIDGRVTIRVGERMMTIVGQPVY